MVYIVTAYYATTDKWGIHSVYARESAANAVVAGLAQIGRQSYVEPFEVKP